MRKLKHLRPKYLDCLDDAEFSGIIVTAVMDYNRTDAVKKLLSWAEFDEILNKTVTLELVTWEGNEYAIDAVIIRRDPYGDDMSHIVVDIPTMQRPNSLRHRFDMQMNASGYDPKLGKFTGVLFKQFYSAD